jgi:peptide/nickel transport system substrate-binding protein
MGAACALAAIACVAACSSNTGNSAGKSQATGSSTGGTLTIAVPAAPVSLNPAQAPTGPSMWLFNLAYSSPIVAQPNGTFTPGLATKWGYANSQQTVFEFTLRSGLRFSDGTPLTAQDAANSLNYEKKNAAIVPADLLPYFKTITAAGPLTVRIDLSQPVPVMPLLLSQLYPMSAIISPAALKDPSSLGAGMFGPGPYELDSSATITNSTYTFVPNKYYPDPSAQHWSQVVIRIIDSPSATLAAIRTGQAQLAYGDPSTYQAAKSAGLSVVDPLSSWYGLIYQRLKTGPLANNEVRTALAYAIDRDSISKAVFPVGTSRPSAQFQVPGAAGYVAGLDDKYPYDPGRAKAMLAAAGYPDGFTFTVAVLEPSAGAVTIAEAMSAELKSIGVNMVVQSISGAQWPSSFPKADAQMLGFGADGIWIDTTFNFLSLSGPNLQHVAIPSVASAFDQAGTLATSAAYGDLASALLTENQYLAVVQAAQPFYYSSSVKGVSATGATEIPNVLDVTP